MRGNAIAFSANWKHGLLAEARGRVDSGWLAALEPAAAASRSGGGSVPTR